MMISRMLQDDDVPLYYDLVVFPLVLIVCSGTPRSNVEPQIANKSQEKCKHGVVSSARWLHDGRSRFYSVHMSFFFLAGLNNVILL